MTKFPATRRNARALRTPGRAVVLPLVAMVALAAGCAEKKHAQAIPWASAIQVRPNPVKAAGAATLPDLTPDLRLELKAPSNDLLLRRQNPARPRGTAGTSDDADTSAEAPSLAPQLSTQEIAEAQRQMNESLGAAERNLKAVQGRQLNTLQADLVSKITGFVRDARRAASVGDWTSARNLAKKAQVLSDELAGGL